jgi:hypothetical protein
LQIENGSSIIPHTFKNKTNWRIKMAFMNQTKKQTIANQLKPIFKKYGLKATLAVDNHSTLVINIAKSSHDFIKNYNQTLKEKSVGETIDTFYPDNYMSVNNYWYDQQFTGTCKQILDEIIKTANSAGQNYNKSDIMSDYHDVGFYLDVNIGKWNKPYEVIVA